MSPGAKLTVIMAGTTTIVLALRWLHRSSSAHPAANREARHEGSMEDIEVPEHDGPSHSDPD